MDINSYIESQIREIESQTLQPAHKADITFNLIQVLHSESIKRNLYKYTKKFIINYLDSLEDRDFGYDTINSEKIIKCISFLQIDEQITITKYLNRKLKERHLESSWSNYEKFESTLTVKKIKDGKLWFLNPINLLKIQYYNALNSVCYLTLLLLFAILVQILILLPNPSDCWPSLFKLTYEPICENFLLNHVSNILLKLIEIDQDFKIKPIGFAGAILILIGTGFKIFILVKFIFDSLLKKIKIHE